MTVGGPETGSDARRGRGVDVMVWVLVAVVWIGLSAAAAWFFSNSQFKLREVEVRDDSATLLVVPPVAVARDAEPLSGPVVPAPPDRPAPAPDAEGVIRPAWVRPPAPLYPALAQSRGIEQGDVRLRCEALASGDLGACEILSETPQGAGFGEAALAATRRARVRPYSIDGLPMDSKMVFTVRFRMAPES
ncbi:TonB family protein [Brevundimonas alba]|uniref:TonB family protein n=1 Tax=Brevundimonas alba TaxID=74314 RepID=A0A7X5YI69_9CAUL|nr:TonB family protein [Brevundimonas alba]NJC40213.1 TonB family protein [Brevundimonas alba]